MLYPTDQNTRYLILNKIIMYPHSSATLVLTPALQVYMHFYSFQSLLSRCAYSSIYSLDVHVGPLVFLTCFLDVHAVPFGREHLLSEFHAAPLVLQHLLFQCPCGSTITIPEHPLCYTVFWHEFVITFCPSSSRFLANLRILSCLVQSKSILFNLFCVCFLKSFLLSVKLLLCNCWTGLSRNPATEEKNTAMLMKCILIKRQCD